MRDPKYLALLIGGIAALLGLIFFTIGYVRGQMISDWVRTTGMVVNKNGGSSPFPAQYPTFRWRDQSGNEHQHTSMVRSSFGPRPGTLVQVLYDPNRPGRGAIDSVVQTGKIFKFIGIGILVVAAFMCAFIFFTVSSLN